MAADLKITISADIKNLTRSLSKSERQVKGFGKSAKTAFGGLKKTLGGVTKMLGPLGVAGGIAGVTALAIKASREIIGFDAALTRLRIQSGTTAEEQIALRKSITDLSVKTGKSRIEIIKALDAIIERTGDMKLASDNMEFMTKASLATGAAMEDVGAIIANIGPKFNLSTGNIQDFFNIVTAQGKQGAFTMENIANQGERLFTAAQRLQVSGGRELNIFGAMMQIGKRTTGSPEEATTAIDNLASEMLKKSEQIQKEFGVSIIDAEESKKQHKTVLKDLGVLLEELMEATGGESIKLLRVFGIRSVKILEGIGKSWQEFGMKELDEFTETNKEKLKTIEKDYDIWSKSSAAAFDRLGTAFTKIADKALAPTIAELAGIIDEMLEDPEAIDEVAQSFEGLASALLGLAKASGAAARAYGKLDDLTAGRDREKGQDLGYSKRLEQALKSGWITQEEAIALNRPFSRFNPYGLNTVSNQRKKLEELIDRSSPGSGRTGTTATGTRASRTIQLDRERLKEKQEYIQNIIYVDNEIKEPTKTITKRKRGSKAARVFTGGTGELVR